MKPAALGFYAVGLAVFAVIQFRCWAQMSRMPLSEREAIVTDGKTAFYNRNPIMYAIFGSVGSVAAVVLAVLFVHAIAAG